VGFSKKKRPFFGSLTFLFLSRKDRGLFGGEDSGFLLVQERPRLPLYFFKATWPGWPVLAHVLRTKDQEVSLFPLHNGTAGAVRLSPPWSAQPTDANFSSGLPEVGLPFPDRGQPDSGAPQVRSFSFFFFHCYSEIPSPKPLFGFPFS